MAKYRKLPVVIDAEQWWPGKSIAGVVDDAVANGGTYLVQPHVQTLEGPMFVSPGDWIIVGVAGERYPCKDEIFRATYEPAEGG